VSAKRGLGRIVWAVVIVAILMVFFVRKGKEIPPIKLKELGSAAKITNPVTSAFRGGEKLTFRVQYLDFIPAGSITMKVKEVSYRGKEAYYLVAEGKTSPLFSFFTRFQSVFESYMDARNLYSLRFQEHARSGRNVDERLTIYDQENGIAETSEEGTPGSRKVKIGKNSQDFLSALYFLRTRELKVGESFIINLNNRKNNYEVEVKILRKAEIKVPAGKFTAYVTEVKVTSVGKNEQGKILTVWLSEKERKLPLLIKAGTKIGPMEVSLIDYGGKQK